MQGLPPSPLPQPGHGTHHPPLLPPCSTTTVPPEGTLTLLSFEFKEVCGLPEPAAVLLEGRHEWGQGGSEPPGVGFDKLRPPASPPPWLCQRREPLKGARPNATIPAWLLKVPSCGSRSFLGGSDVVYSWGGRGEQKQEDVGDFAVVLESEDWGEDGEARVTPNFGGCCAVPNRHFCKCGTQRTHYHLSGEQDFC